MFSEFTAWDDCISGTWVAVTLEVFIIFSEPFGAYVAILSTYGNKIVRKFENGICAHKY